MSPYSEPRLITRPQARTRTQRCPSAFDSSEGERFAAEVLESYDDVQLADAIATRLTALQTWKRIYHDDFIPFAHGVRQLALYYNDAVQPTMTQLVALASAVVECRGGMLIIRSGTASASYLSYCERVAGSDAFLHPFVSVVPTKGRGKRMQTFVTIIQLVIALGILNVWLVRYKKQTGWRGGDAKNMTEEFQVYGLPMWSMYVVGLLKILFATLLILGVWLPSVTKPAAIGMAILMLGAVVMHIKVKDAPKKSLPALSLFVLCLVVAVL